MDQIVYLSTATIGSIQYSRCSMKTKIHNNRSAYTNRVNCALLPQISGLVWKMFFTLLHTQSMEMNPGFAHGMRGTLLTDYRMTRVCELGGLVESPVPTLRDIKKSYAIW